MEQSYIIITASIVIIYLPTIFVGIPKSIKISKETKIQEKVYWLNAASHGGIWLPQKGSKDTQTLIDPAECFKRAQQCEKGLTGKDYLGIIGWAFFGALKLQILLIVGWVIIQMMFIPPTT